MKKSMVLIGLLLGGPVQAATLFGVHLGADLWQTEATGGFGSSADFPDSAFDKQSLSGYFVAIEHGVPVLPNLRWQRQQLQSDGALTLNAPLSFAGATFVPAQPLQTTLALNHQSYTLYYELLDNALVQLDLGVTAKYLNGQLAVETASQRATQTLKQWLPLLYLDAKVVLPGTGFDVFGQIQGVNWQGSHVYDVEAGLGYTLVDTLLLDARLKLGYRLLDIKLDDVDNLYAGLRFSGIFAGFSLHF